MNESITAIERDVLMKLESGNYILKFGQIYRIKQATLFPIGPQLGRASEDLRDKGLIERRMITINGCQFKADVITNSGRKRLAGS